MFYLFELMLFSIGIDGQATIEQRISAPNQGAQCSFRDGQWNSGSFAAFRMETKMGTSKMDRRDQELLDKQMRRLVPPRNDGAIAVMLAAAMFLVGMALGSVLSAHQSEPIQIASME
jgi:hypothetical protein